MPPFDVCALDELSLTGLTEVEAGGVKVLLARTGESVLATGARCPHKGAPLKKGLRVGTDVICPWHHAVFDLRTGATEAPPSRECLARFGTRVENGRVLVEVPEGATGDVPRATPADRKGGGSRVFVIVGAGAAGVECATELVRLGFDGRIVLLEAEDEDPYDRTDLSKVYLQGKKGDGDLAIDQRADLVSLGVEWRRARVERVDAANRAVVLAGGERLAYDACFAAPGSDAVPLDAPGAELEGVFTLRSHADAAALKRAAGEAKRIVVVGSGFIGLEAAGALAGDGRTVTVLARGGLPFEKQFGEAVARRIAARHREKGVEILTETTLARLHGENGRVAAVETADGRRIEADLVLAALGAAPRSALIEGVQRSGKGIRTDGRLEAAPALFVGGDVAEVPVAGWPTPMRIEHWRVAESHGRFAAAAMLGSSAPFDGVPFFWTAQGGPLRYVGHSEGFDEVHVEGDLAGDSFTAFYSEKGVVNAALGAGDGDQTPAVHALFRRGERLSRETLEGVGWDARTLL